MRKTVIEVFEENGEQTVRMDGYEKDIVEGIGGILEGFMTAKIKEGEKREITAEDTLSRVGMQMVMVLQEAMKVAKEKRNHS